MGINSISAKENAKQDETFKVVEVMPEYNGGKTALINYISTNIKYPDKAKKEGISAML